MILVNGCAKTGTNLALKLCGALGLTHSGCSLVRLLPGVGVAGRRVTDDEGGKVEIPADNVLCLPDQYFSHGHVAVGPPGEALERVRMILCWRDPRDAAVSYVRWAKATGRAETATHEDLLALLRGTAPVPWQCGRPVSWVEYFAGYLAWHGRPNVFDLHFHRIAEPETVAAVASFLGVDCPDPEGVAAKLLGNGSEIDGVPMYKGRSSWSGGPRSNWREWWSEDAEAIWRDTMGSDLIEAMGPPYSGDGA